MSMVGYNSTEKSIVSFISEITMSALHCCSIQDCGTVGIPPLMSKRTLGILDGGRGGAVDLSWRRRGITGVDKGGA